MTEHDRRAVLLAFHANKAAPSESGWDVGLLRFEFFCVL